MIIVSERERYEHAWHDDIAKAQHRESALGCESNRLGPQQLYLDIKSCGDLDHLRIGISASDRHVRRLDRTDHFRSEHPPDVIEEKAAQQDAARLEGVDRQEGKRVEGER